MAKAKKKLDIPEGWEVSEEQAPKEKKKRDFELSNNILWALFVVLVIGFSLFFIFWPKALPQDMETTYLNNIQISAPGDPIILLKGLGGRHLIGKTIKQDASNDANNALLEIGSILGSSGLVTYGGKHNLEVGITDRTGIFIGESRTTIEGATRAEFWNAVWTFTSTISDTEIITDGTFFEIQDLLDGRQKASLVIDTDGACSSYSYIISASGDVLQALGFKQASEDFTIYQYNESEESCNLQFSVPETNETGCPEANAESFVITLKKGTKNQIEVRENEIYFFYSGCESLARVSVLVRDLLAPEVISGTREVVLPDEL